MSVGIDFILRASTAGFTKGLAAANNKLQDLKKTLKVGDVGNGLKQLLGAGAIIAGMRAVINHAQETRKALEDLGKPIPGSVASVARLADGFDDIKNTVISAGTAVLGFIVKIGELNGDAINLVRKSLGHGQLIDPKLGAQLEKDADAMEARRNAAYTKNAQANSPEALKAAQAKLQADIERGDDKQRSHAERILKLKEEQAKLEAEAFRLRDMNDKKQLVGGQAQVTAAYDALTLKDEELRAATEAQKTDADKSADLQKKLQEQKKKLKDMGIDKYLPSLEELAMSVGARGLTDAQAEAAKKAQQSFRLEEQAGFAAGRGDIAGALDLQSKAQAIRNGLGGFAKSSDLADPTKSLNDGIDETNKQLVEVNKKLGGIFTLKAK